MRAAVVISISLLHLVACAASAPNQGAASDYGRAIEEAVVQGIDRRGDLRGCVVKWDSKFPARSRLKRDVLDNRNELKTDSILLEIGSSGWIRYDYVYVEGTRLKSSFDGAGDLDISGTALEKYLNDLSEHEVENLAGRASSTAMDAPCYFLSIKRSASMKTVAVYGSLQDSSADVLIKELLAVVHSQK